MSTRSRTRSAGLTPPTPSMPSSPARSTPSTTPAGAAMFSQLQRRTPQHRGIPKSVTPACDVRLRVFRGQQGLLQFRRLMVSESNPAKAQADKKYVASNLCRDDVSWNYIHEHLTDRKTNARVFAIAAVSKGTGQVMGFALIKVYAPSAGKRRMLYRSSGVAVGIPINRRTAMLDLICTRDDCKGLGGLLLAAMKSECRKLNVELLMLEATAAAAGYYIMMGFRRVPDACSLMYPRDANEKMRVALQVALARSQYTTHPFSAKDRAAGFKYVTDKTGKQVRVRQPSLVEAAALNTVTGPVWYTGYNRGSQEDENYTVVMSMCIRGKNDSRVYTQADPKMKLFNKKLKFDPLGVRQHVNEGRRWQSGRLFEVGKPQYAGHRPTSIQWTSNIASAPYFKPSGSPPQPTTPPGTTRARVASAAARQVATRSRARRA